ncbi:MAG: flagellin [Candidatus Latescibacteria bacterium]|nr:flagellin [Candidatus Latescibacterota bacterium]
MAFDFSRINTNLAALQSLNALNGINRRLGEHQLRLATGKQINSPSDNSAGYTIATKLGVRASGLGQALDNIGSAKNLIAVSEGHLTNINDILASMKVKASEAANDTLGTAERSAILEDLQRFNDQIDQEYAQAKWNSVDLLHGGSDFKFQIGAGTTENISDFNIAKQVWSGGGTGFNSAGLNVVASSTSVDTLSTSTLSTDYASVAMGTGATLLGGLTELSSGYYTLEVATASAGANTVTATITLRDANGDAVRLSASGSGSSTDTSLSTTFAGSTLTNLNLGVGFSLATLTGISTSGAESALYGITYTQGGNTVGDQDQAETFMQQIDDAIANVSAAMRYTGAIVNRLTYQETSLTVAKTNTLAAQSRIMDADMAYEQLEASKLQILQQTATAMLAQANTMPQNILTLFR